MKTYNYRYHRKGMVLVWSVLVVVVLLGFMTLAVDVGYLYNVKANLQNAADASALAGASGLYISTTEATNRALQYAQKNKAEGVPIVLQNSDIELGAWNAATRTFTVVTPSPTVWPTAVRVTPQLTKARGNSLSLFFANVLGITSVDASAQAVAVYGARDIMLTLDLSGSMNYDSQVMGIAKLGQAAVEANFLGMYQDLGSPTYGTKKFPSTAKTKITGTNAQVLASLGLTGVAYPYPSGSWNEYINYVKNSWYYSYTNTDLSSYGYQDYYGYITYLNYLQDNHARAADTPDLWKTREQPVGAVKDAVTLFLAYMQLLPTDDNVGLAAFTSVTGVGIVQQSLTSNYALVQSAATHDQAGHYQDYTNIGGGLQASLNELAAHGRIGDAHVIILLSDGQSNWYRNQYDLAGARADAINQAYAAAAAKTPIITIALGADADIALMQQIAQISQGVAFVVPGGKNVNDYKDQLNAVFTQIVGYRPLQLVY